MAEAKDAAEARRTRLICLTDARSERSPSMEDIRRMVWASSGRNNGLGQGLVGPNGVSENLTRELRRRIARGIPSPDAADGLKSDSEDGSGGSGTRGGEIEEADDGESDSKE